MGKVLDSSLLTTSGLRKKTKSMIKKTTKKKASSNSSSATNLVPNNGTGTNATTDDTTVTSTTNNGNNTTGSAAANTTGNSLSTNLITVTGKPSTGQATKYYQYKDYTKTWQNLCMSSSCQGKYPGTLTDNPKGVLEHEITCSKCDSDYDVTTGGDKSGSYRFYLKDANGRSNTKDSVDTTIGDATSGSGSTTQQSGTSSPLLSGEMTFQELIGEITNGIDLLFICKRNNVVVTDFETIYAEAAYLREKQPSAVSSEDIQLWQLEHDSYEMTIDQYGFYNTVIVEYDKGKVTESFQDLVRIYGEMPITYKEKDLTKSMAQMKAKAYLAAHIRDYGMTIKCSILHDGGIDVGDIVTLENPLTLRDAIRKSEGKLPEYLFVNGVSVNWDDGGIIKSDLELTYSPESPERNEPKNSSTSTSSSGSSTSNTTSNADGSTTTTNADGSSTTTYSDGSTATTDANGNVTTTAASNGSVGQATKVTKVQPIYLGKNLQTASQLAKSLRTQGNTKGKTGGFNTTALGNTTTNQTQTIHTANDHTAFDKWTTKQLKGAVSKVTKFAQGLFKW